MARLLQAPPGSKSRRPSVSTSPAANTQRAASRPPTPEVSPAPRTADPIPEVYIAVLGQTGTGKSTFINNVLGHSQERTVEGVKFMKVGHDLEACTDTRTFPSFRFIPISREN
jgi:GTPase SAR1 family protein